MEGTNNHPKRGFKRQTSYSTGKGNSYQNASKEDWGSVENSKKKVYSPTSSELKEETFPKGDASWGTFTVTWKGKGGNNLQAEYCKKNVIHYWGRVR